MGEPRQTLGAGRHFGRRGRPGRHHAGLRLRQFGGCAGHRHRRRSALLLGATSLKLALRYDDSLDAFGVHGIGGFVGAILTGVFAIEAIGGDGKKGLIDGNAGQVLTQLWGCLVCMAWCAIATFVILKVVDALIGLRVSNQAEVEGLDINLHGETVH